MYQTMKIETISKMIPFFDVQSIEKIAVDSVKHAFISMKVDHMSGAIHFKHLVRENNQFFCFVRFFSLMSHKEVTNHLFQDLESDGLCDHLVVLTESLNKARSMIYAPVKRQSKLGDNITYLAEIVEKEHQRLLARKYIIEKRKEEHERQMQEQVSTFVPQFQDRKFRFLLFIIR